MHRFPLAILFSRLLGTGVYAQAAMIALTWQDATNTTHDGYVMQRRTNVATSPYGEIGRTAKTVMAFTDTSVVDGQGYCYRVAAFRAAPAQISPYSNEVCGVGLTVLIAPINLILTQPGQ
jgi:hypothetical protein